MRRTTRKPQRGVLALLVMALATVTFLAFASAAGAQVAGAGFTTKNEDVDGPGTCLNGPGIVNCNIYTGKEFVWINGGPNQTGPSALTNGTYFFAVLEPGGQPDPNDGGAKNLSDTSPDGGTDDACGDPYRNRTFTVSGGDITSYTGDGGDYCATNGTDLDPHDQDASATQGLQLRLFPYDTTGNQGGVYILAICKYDPSDSSTYPVDPKNCKYDAFKVRKSEEAPPASDLAIVKNAAASSENKYAWQIQKCVTVGALCPTSTTVKQIGGTVTFNYVVSVSHDAGTPGNWQVVGHIIVLNPNDDPVDDVLVTDQIKYSSPLVADPNVTCPVTGGNVGTLAGNDTATLDYTCTYTDAPAATSETNIATVTWNPDIATGATPSSSASFNVPFTFPAPAVIDECVGVTDSFDGQGAASLGTACVGDANPKTFNFSKNVAVPRFGCIEKSNTAVFTTNDTGVTGSASATVDVCGPAQTGGLTMGFWQNKNGQGTIKTSAATAGTCNLTVFLRAYAPYQDLSASANCPQAATYVYNIVKAATSAGSSMNPMLKAQMLATALDVYFSDSALGGNAINAPAAIGGVTIDLTKICHMIDSSGGSATCSGVYRNVSAVFGGAASLTVSQMLTFAASQSNAGGSTWYANVKPTQELAKDAFDAINNQVAFAA